MSKNRVETALEMVENPIEKKRVKAILDCFGVEAYKEKKCVFIEETGEEISYWYIEGFLNVEDLLSVLTLEIVEHIYDSGL